ncbi:MAG: 2-C-methyl-D-erythritol 4-phosphate cytidylyltransferase [Elusimicrobiota bacterium]|jgi:2-C-methyl-D-erythritol 4-phosphate cytidylyltransferase|nr:2-C-methyl-D-erythritol 4-phosphate cytidylyltransferase [Elusimicrobiota bacterium]
MKAVSVIIVAGGAGKRMGRPKQMLLIGAKAVLARSVEAMAAVKPAQIIVVTAPDIFTKLSKTYAGLEYAPAGQTRLQSVINGVSKVSPKSKLIAVHDGARPFVSPAAALACLKAAAKNKAAVLAAPVKDTIKVVKSGRVVKTLDRALLYAAQTPQCYRAQTLKAALKKYGRLKNATDESQLVEKMGVKVAAVLSGYENIKITTPEDLIFADAICKTKKKNKLK